jgi:two-component system chemotaxis response regulator CheB
VGSAIHQLIADPTGFAPGLLKHFNDFLFLRPTALKKLSAIVHLCLHRKMTGEVVIRTPTTPATLFVPSVGVMMASVLSIYGTDTIGVLMTGIGDDGADQMVAIKQAGGHTIAESEQTAVVYGMPREAVERGGACVVAPSHQVAGEILKAVRRTTE